MKETIVFVHGVCHGAWCWEEKFIPFFQNLGYECIALNLPGHETPGSTQRISYSLNDYVQALHQAVAKLDQPPIIVGHSMGGMILQRFLKTGTCKKAILLSAVPPSGALMASIRVIGNNLGTLPYLFTRNLLGVFRKYPLLMFNKAKIAEKYASKMCAESFLAFVTLVLPIFHKISTPLLVVGGSKDQLITVNEFAQTAKRYGAKLEIIEGGSHDLMLDDDYLQTTEAIKNWLEEK
jgi:pimeloyl-ACP methyl ester carboxylesterase